MYFVTETISEIISMSTKKIGLVSGADLLLSRAYDSENGVLQFSQLFTQSQREKSLKKCAYQK